ncbi:MAG TPA: hypothetical protein VFZ78_05145 [Flavisolibacter sp.]
MNRLIAIFFTLSYLAASSGINLHYHFCMGEAAGISFGKKEETSTCSRCGMEKGHGLNGCCTDEHVWLKIQDDHKINTLSNAQWVSPPMTFALNFSSFGTIVFSSQSTPLVYNEAPPDDSGVFLRNRNLRL